MQLLVTVEQGPAWIVGDEVECEFLKAAQHHHVLDHARGGFAAYASQLEAMPVQVQRVNVVAGVSELEPGCPS